MQIKIGVIVKSGDADYDAETKASVDNDKNSFFVSGTLLKLMMHNNQAHIYKGMTACKSGTAFLYDAFIQAVASQFSNFLVDVLFDAANIRQIDPAQVSKLYASGVLRVFNSKFALTVPL
jgi:3-deoxy-D-manno-octulosonic acid (KDO) 8-phosphate synthase